MKKKKKHNKTKITIEDYIKAIKKTDREVQLETSAGWVAVTKIHNSKKTYSRKKVQKNFFTEG